MPIISSPKERFQQSKDRLAVHREIFSDPRVEEAFDVALLQYQRLLAFRTASKPEDAAALHYMETGAVHFVDMLKRLGESDEIPKYNRPLDNLAH